MAKANLQMLAQMERADLRKVISGPRGERDFSIAVREYAEAHNWKCHYMMVSATRTASGNYKGLGPPGFPDLFMVRGKQIVAAELKSETGSTTPDQRAWLTALAEVPGVSTFIWKPRDAATAMKVLR